MMASGLCAAPRTCAGMSRSHSAISWTSGHRRTRPHPGDLLRSKSASKSAPLLTCCLPRARASGREVFYVSDCAGAPEMIRTSDLCLRRATLRPSVKGSSMRNGARADEISVCRPALGRELRPTKMSNTAKGAPSQPLGIHISNFRWLDTLRARHRGSSGAPTERHDRPRPRGCS
jgi:hypothetical protein